MRDAREVLRGMFPQSTEPFCTHMSTDKLRKSLEMGNFGNDIAAKRGQGSRGNTWAGVKAEGYGRSVGRHVSRASKRDRGRVSADPLLESGYVP